jgi:hypothetical protein
MNSEDCASMKWNESKEDLIIIVLVTLFISVAYLLKY